MVKNVLSIAGSDPSGGAGIQADLKAISANGAYAMAAITALTAQNTQGVEGVHLVPPSFVAEQVDAVFRDIEVHAVKIGMIATAEIARTIARVLAGRDTLIVLDPVMVAKGGARLLAEDAVTAVRDALLPLATVVTPNLPEAAQLLGRSVASTRAQMQDQAEALVDAGARAALVKGGHLEGPQSPDCLVTHGGATWFEAPRVATTSTHGTGCTLSAALAARLANERNVVAAVKSAKDYVSAAIAGAAQLRVGSGHGPTHHFATLWKPA
ncbi:MAG: bifunctional hydroxymethylpyrimidine kinase/phosphomethylpyrimidine kinase [Myxococcota bacterium]